jgi:transposase-like protein
LIGIGANLFRANDSPHIEARGIEKLVRIQLFERSGVHEPGLDIAGNGDNRRTFLARIHQPVEKVRYTGAGGSAGSGANARVAGDDEEMQRFVPIEYLFKGRHFDGQIIILCVAWYTSFKLSLRDLVIMMADRGISVTHTTILRWIQRYLPEFEKRWWRYARPVGGSWRMDETYIKVHGQWMYLYRAVDKAGQTADFFLRRNWDVNAAKSFLRSAMKNTRVPTKITLDAYAASHRAVREMKEDGELPRRVKVRSSQYLNNLVEQDHRRVKQRTRPMLGFKRFDSAAVTISGIELAEKIKKGQYKRGKLGGRKATMSELWNAALAA